MFPPQSSDTSHTSNRSSNPVSAGLSVNAHTALTAAALSMQGASIAMTQEDIDEVCEACGHVCAHPLLARTACQCSAACIAPAPSSHVPASRSSLGASYLVLICNYHEWLGMLPANTLLRCIAARHTLDRIVDAQSIKAKWRHCTGASGRWTKAGKALSQLRTF